MRGGSVRRPVRGRGFPRTRGRGGRGRGRGRGDDFYRQNQRSQPGGEPPASGRRDSPPHRLGGGGGGAHLMTNRDPRLRPETDRGPGPSLYSDKHLSAVLDPRSDRGRGRDMDDMISIRHGQVRSLEERHYSDTGQVARQEVMSTRDLSQGQDLTQGQRDFDRGNVDLLSESARGSLDEYDQLSLRAKRYDEDSYDEYIDRPSSFSGEFRAARSEYKDYYDHKWEHSREREEKRSTDESPEYFSTNYPTTEYDDDAYYKSDRGRVGDERQGYGRRECSRSPGPVDNFQDDEFEYDDQDQGRSSERDMGMGEHDICESPRGSRERNSGPRDSQYDRELVSPGRNGNDGERGHEREEESIWRPSDDFGSRPRREDVREPSVGHDRLREGAEGELRREELSTERDSRSRSSSLQKDQPAFQSSNPMERVDSDLMQPQHQSPHHQDLSQAETVKPSQLEPKTSLVITVTNDQCLGQQDSGPASAMDRLGPPVTKAVSAAERLGPPVTAQQGANPTPAPVPHHRRKKNAPVVDEDFDLYADIPPPENQSEQMNISEPKEALVITFQTKRDNPEDTDQRPSAPSQPRDNSEAQGQSNMAEAEMHKPQAQNPCGLDDVSPPSEPDQDSKKPSVSVVTIPKSKWESDEESSDQHIVLLPKSLPPEPKVEPVKPVKKRDPSLHVGQIVKDIRYNNPAAAKKSLEAVSTSTEKAMPSKDKPDAKQDQRSESKKQKEEKKKKSKDRDRDRHRDRRSRSRDRSEKRHRHEHRRGDRRQRSRSRSRSDSRERHRRRSPTYSYGRGRFIVRGRGREYYDKYRYTRGGRGNRGRRYWHTDRRRGRSRSRSRSRSRERRHSRHSRRRSRESSYSSRSSWSRSRSSSRSSSRSRSRSSSYSRSSFSSSSRSRSQSKEKDSKSAGRRDKISKPEESASDPKVAEEDIDVDTKEAKKDKNVTDNIPESIERPGDTASNEIDVFTGELMPKPSIPPQEAAKDANPGEAANPLVFAKGGGLDDPLGLKQLTKPMKSKVYSGPILDMPPLTVTATSEPAAKPSLLPVPTAKPLKSILKKKGTAPPVSKEQTTPVSIPSVTACEEITKDVGPDLTQLTSLLATLAPQSSQPLSQSVASLLTAVSGAQQQQQQQQYLVQQQMQQQRPTPSAGFFGAQGDMGIPGLGGDNAVPSSASDAFSLLGALGGSQHSLPGFEGNPAAGGTYGSAVEGFGPASSANVGIIPGLGNQATDTHTPATQSADNSLSAIIQQSGIKLTPELSALLAGTQQSQQPSQMQQQQQQQLPQSNPLSGLFGAQTTLQSGLGFQRSQGIPFLSELQPGQANVLEEEDQFLYGETKPAQSHVGYNEMTSVAQPQFVTSQAQHVHTSFPGQGQYAGQAPVASQEEYVPETKSTGQPQPMDSAQIQNILTAIGFDFDMAKKVAIEKEKGIKAGQEKEQESQSKHATAISQFLEVQRSEADIKAQTDSDPAVSSADYKLEGLNQTASFLVTGLQVPATPAPDEMLKPGKKKKKKDKGEVKKKKKEKSVEKINTAAGKLPREQDSNLQAKKSGEISQYADGKGAKTRNEDEYTEKSKRGDFDREDSKKSNRSSKVSSGSPVMEPVSDESDHEASRKRSQYPDLANIKIEVAQETTSSDTQPNRRIVLLPQGHDQPYSYDGDRHTAREESNREKSTKMWHQQQEQQYEEGYFHQREWEARERKRIEEEIRSEYQERMLIEKEKRRHDMLKKEQEWLMREVALKTMEEKIRREEEKLQREKELRRREEQRKEDERMYKFKKEEEERQYRLKKEKEEYQRQLVVLERELLILRKQQGELMRRKQHQKDGHKDPLLVKNNRLQEEIVEEIRTLRKAYSTRTLEDRGEKERRSLSTERSGSSREERDRDRNRDREKGKASTSQSKRESVEERPESKARFQFAYFDNGDHWCRTCQKSFLNLDEFFIHLHSKKHVKQMDPMDRPWMGSDLKSSKEASTEGMIQAPVKGGEFMMPVNGFYCRLCKEFYGDGVCGTEHMKSPSHNLAYQKFVDEHKQYEKQLDLEKLASSNSQESGPGKDKEEEEEKGTKRKAEDGGDAQDTTKQLKKEPSDVKVTRKQKDGFGTFEFTREKDTEAVLKRVSNTMPPPLELRKDAGSSNTDGAAPAKKDANKLSIKLSSAKRLIPTALLRGKNTQAPSATPASPSTSTTVTTTEAPVLRSRSVRSTTLVQRQMPMIGKRPTRKVKEPEAPPSSNLDAFLQGASGKALPVISDKSEAPVIVEETKSKEADKEAATKFVLKESDIVCAFQGKEEDSEGTTRAAEDQEVQSDEDEESEELPAVPGSEGAQAETCSLPAPIPPPPAT